MTLSNCYLIHPVPLNHHIFHTAVNTGVWSLLLFLITFYRGRLWNLTSHMGTSRSKSKKGRHIPSTLGQICATFVTFWIVSLNLLLVVISNMSLLNPGPGKTNKNISVVYHNTRGLVCFSELSKKGQRLLDTTKVLELLSRRARARWACVSSSPRRRKHRPSALARVGTTRTQLIYI